MSGTEDKLRDWAKEINDNFIMFEAADEIEALKHDLEQYMEIAKDLANPWQTIETAPKNKVLVWGYWPEQPQKYDQMYRVGELWYSGQDEAGCRECPCSDPTHWMPLPEPPIK